MLRTTGCSPLFKPRCEPLVFAFHDRMDICRYSVSLKSELHLTHRRGKAVANGAVSYYLDRLVTVRIARTTFGSKMNTHYQPNNPEHQRRASTLHTNLAGEQVVPNAFRVILPKVYYYLHVQTGFDRVHPHAFGQGTRITDTTKFSQSFNKKFSSTAHLWSTTMSLTTYRGENKKPQWIDIEPGESFLYCWIAWSHERGRPFNPTRHVRRRVRSGRRPQIASSDFGASDGKDRTTILPF